MQIDMKKIDHAALIAESEALHNAIKELWNIK